MRRAYNKSLQRFLDAWPGKRYFGMYRFLPIFFVLGASVEFAMINWHVGEVNFCKLSVYFVILIGIFKPATVWELNRVVIFSNLYSVIEFKIFSLHTFDRQLI